MREQQRRIDKDRRAREEKLVVDEILRNVAAHAQPGVEEESIPFRCAVKGEVIDGQEDIPRGRR